MKSSEPRSDRQREIDDSSRSQKHEPAGQPTQRARVRTDFVDSYEVRLEPQPEEPGYGHGV